jgi:hypothetical protein
MKNLLKLEELFLFGLALVNHVIPRSEATKNLYYGGRDSSLRSERHNPLIRRNLWKSNLEIERSV